MKYSNIKKYTLVIFLLGFILYILTSSILASYAIRGSPVDAIGEIGVDGSLVGDDGKLGGALKTVIAVLQMAGTGIAIIVVTILGIKYMTASVEAKAEVKKEIMPVLIGMILLFGGVNFTAIVANIVDKAF